MPSQQAPPQTYPALFPQRQQAQRGPAQVTNWEKDEFEKHAEEAARERVKTKDGQAWLDAYDGKAPSPAPVDPRGPEPGAHERAEQYAEEQRAMLRKIEHIRQTVARNAKIGQTKYPGWKKK